MSFRRKLALTTILLILFTALGTSYQYYYLEERAEFERSIQSYYIKHHGTALDENKLRHLAILALDRFGPTELIRNDDDYQKLLKDAMK